METPIIVAAVGILGILLGASVQFFFNKKTEDSRHLKLLQTQAYVDFMKGLSGMGRAQFFKDKEKEKEFTILLADARARISIYGSERGIKKLAELFRKYDAVSSESEIAAYSELIKIMREESLKKSDFVSNFEIGEVVFGGNSNGKEILLNEEKLKK